MNKILIVVSGGVIQAVHSNEDVEIFIVDHDNRINSSPQEIEQSSELLEKPISPDTIGMVEEVLKEEIKDFKS